MGKKWEEMTQEEKIDDLRRDVKTIFSHLNMVKNDVQLLAGKLNEHATILTRVQKAAKIVAEKIEQLFHRPGAESQK